MSTRTGNVETLEMYVRRSDGRCYIEASARNDERGRRDIERTAAHALTRADVIAVECIANHRVGRAASR